jgi:hypothetical protein
MNPGPAVVGLAFCEKICEFPGRFCRPTCATSCSAIAISNATITCAGSRAPDADEPDNTQRRRMVAPAKIFVSKAVRSIGNTLSSCMTAWA